MWTSKNMNILARKHFLSIYKDTKVNIWFGIVETKEIQFNLCLWCAHIHLCLLWLSFPCTFVIKNRKEKFTVSRWNDGRYLLKRFYFSVVFNIPSFYFSLTGIFENVATTTTAGKRATQERSELNLRGGK